MLENFKEEFRPVKVIRYDTGDYDDDGEWIPGGKSEDETEMICRPITPASVKMFPEGTYISEDRRFYGIGKPRYRQKDVIEFEESRFEIKDIQDRSFDGNFTVYFSKRIVKEAKDA